MVCFKRLGRIFLCSLLGIVMGFGGLVFRACFCVSEVDTLKRTIMGGRHYLGSIDDCLRIMRLQEGLVRETNPIHS